MINLPEKFETMIRIVADDKIPFLKGALEPFAEVVYMPGNQINNEVLKNADALTYPYPDKVYRRVC